MFYTSKFIRDSFNHEFSPALVILFKIPSPDKSVGTILDGMTISVVN
jgi:hypothetical protein